MTSPFTRTTCISDELAAFLGVEGGNIEYKMIDIPLMLLKRYKEHVNQSATVTTCNLADDPETRAILEIPEGARVSILCVQKYLKKHYRQAQYK